MINLQLEMNLDNLSNSDLKFVDMEKQISTMSESLHKVRKKLFAEIGQLKKTLQEVQLSNVEILQQLQEANEKLGKKNEVKFDYEKKDCLFSITEAQEATG